MEQKIIIMYKNNSGNEMFYTEENFKIKKLGEIINSSETQPLSPAFALDKCVIVENPDIENYFILNNATIINPANAKLANRIDDFTNPYIKICGDEDYNIIQEAKRYNALVVTNDYGLFLGGIKEGLLLPIYMPDRNQLIRGPTYFIKYKLLKELNNKVWQLENKIKNN